MEAVFIKKALLDNKSQESFLKTGAGRRNRTPIIGLEGRGNSHYTIPAWWRVMDSNHRRHSQQIYSLPPLAARETLQIVVRILKFFN